VDFPKIEWKVWLFSCIGLIAMLRVLWSTLPELLMTQRKLLSTKPRQEERRSWSWSAWLWRAVWAPTLQADTSACSSLDSVPKVTWPQCFPQPGGWDGFVTSRHCLAAVLDIPMRLVGLLLKFIVLSLVLWCFKLQKTFFTMT